MPKDGDIGGRLQSGDLTLEFVWRGDRFTHRVVRDKDPLQASVEPGLETPAYQEVHQQGDIVFASGMSGDRHWSASVTPCENGFAFDVACRVRSEPPSLVIAYQGDGAISVSPVDNTGLSTPTPAKQLLRLPASEEPLPYTLQAKYRIDGGELR